MGTDAEQHEAGGCGAAGMAVVAAVLLLAAGVQADERRYWTATVFAVLAVALWWALLSYARSKVKK